MTTLIADLVWRVAPALRPERLTLMPPAGAIVTGDKDLLEMKSFAGIPIINATDALKRLASVQSSGPG